MKQDVCLTRKIVDICEKQKLCQISPVKMTQRIANYMIIRAQVDRRGIGIQVAVRRIL
jgi:hypothetical protein